MGNGLLTMSMKSHGTFFTEIPDGYIAESIVDSLSTGVIFTDCNGILTFMNRKAEILLQVFKETVIGKRIDMLPLRTPVYKVMSEDCRDFPLEMNICGRVIEVRSSGLFSPENELLGDITELFDVTLERREKRSREEFVAKMTHDLKSPLMVMQGYMQAVKLGMWGEIHPKVGKILEDMERSGKSLYSMIEDLLDVYRLEMGLVQIKRQSCDLRTLLEECCRDRRLEADEQGVSLTLRIPEELPPMELDIKHLSRVFANVIGNAVKFTSRRGKVTVTAFMRGDDLHVAVRDTGIGISEKDIPRVFNKYFRAEQAAGFKGTGLGLALSKEIVEAHGGAIAIESVEGKGSTFTVILPIRE
jgi:signal transduction histidine kinase